jgi:hypothetical protein
LLTECESLDFALTRIANDAGRSAASSRVETALFQEFQRTKGKSARRRMQWRMAVIGVAAALFLVLGLSLQRFYAPSRDPRAGSQPNLPKSAAERSASAAPAQKTVQDSTQSKSKTPQIAAQASDELDEAEVAQNFTPLPYADDPSMIEGGSVVRVILTRSALASFGMPLTGVENAEQIPADLVVSADGTPEAIRLVAQNVN